MIDPRSFRVSAQLNRSWGLHARRFRLAPALAVVVGPLQVVVSWGHRPGCACDSCGARRAFAALICGDDED